MAEASCKAFIVGHPIAHSRSPMIHGYWLAEFGVAGSYERIDVIPSGFPEFMRQLPRSGFVGGNVTIPHKETAHRLADRCDEAAEAIGAANTLWIDDGLIHASNTDAMGYAADLDARADEWRNAATIVVLGAGGASRAVIFAALQHTKARIHVVNRTVARARELSDRFGHRVSAHGIETFGELATNADLLVNTTSLGMSGKGEISIEIDRLPTRAIVSDIVYTPLKTPLLATAEERGLKTVDGLGMLLHQAVPGFERWFGKRPTVTAELRALLVADIEAKA